METTAVLTDDSPFPTGYSCSTSTPWGAAQYAYKYARGIINYSCAGHGGFHLSATRNAQVLAVWRNADGWYEEDCEWAIVALTFPEAFAPTHVAQAHQSARDYFPDGYHLVFPEAPLDHTNSYKLACRKFAVDHADDYVAVSAISNQKGDQEETYVEVVASLGGAYTSQGNTRWLVFPVPD